DERWQVPGTGEQDQAAPRVPLAVDRGDEHALLEGADEQIEPREQRRRRMALEAVAAYRRTELAHHGGGAQPPAHDVTDHEADPTAGQRGDVVEVTADVDALLSGKLTHRDHGPRRLRNAFRQQR